MLATDKQINYLCKLANKIELIKNINKEKKAILVPLPNYIDWQEERHLGVTVTDASVRIQAYKKKFVLAISLFCCVTFRKYNGITGVIGPAIFGGFDSRNVTNFKKFML